MAESVVIIGCGGHGREIFGIVQAINEAESKSWNVLGFIDDAPSQVGLKRLEGLGASYLGTSKSIAHLETSTQYVIGVGDPRIRSAIAARIELRDLRAATLIHPMATIGSGTVVGDGSVLFAGARVTTNVVLGRHVHINQNATVGHDSVLADCVSVHPLAAVSGDCQLEACVLIGTTAAILQGLRIGASAIVGAGACVVGNVEAGSTVKGVPAR
jgi:sugar O-acyltransferase (sialic acid O-acetyltransferase NeuD family)